MKPTLLLLACAGALVGCALLGKNDPLVPRYFSLADSGAPPATAARRGPELRLGRIEGWAHLRERLVSRSASRELVFHEDRRWTEQPEVYLRHALSRTLFEERGLVESLAGRAPTLDVTLVAFEEIASPHAARLQARMVLRADRVALLEETITVEVPVPASADGDEARAVVDALSLALHAGAEQIADRTVAALATAGPALQ